MGEAGNLGFSLSINVDLSDDGLIPLIEEVLLLFKASLKLFCYKLASDIFINKINIS